MIGQADIVITDAPIVLSAVYRPDHYPEDFDRLVLWLHRQYVSYNVFVQRSDFAGSDPFETNIDRKLGDFLVAHGLTPLCFAHPSREEASLIADNVIEAANLPEGVRITDPFLPFIDAA